MPHIEEFCPVVAALFETSCPLGLNNEEHPPEVPKPKSIRSEYDDRLLFCPSELLDELSHTDVNNISENDDEGQEDTIEHIALSVYEIFVSGKGVRCEQHELALGGIRKVSYNIHDAISDHSDNVEIRDALSTLAQVGGVVVQVTSVAFYASSLVLCPGPTIAYTSLKLLRHYNMLDNYCTGEQNNILLGYNICDLVEESLYAFSLNSIGHKVSFLISNAGNYQTLLKITYGITSKAFFSRTAIRGDGVTTPEITPYIAQELSGELVKYILESAPLPKIAVVFAYKVVGKGSKHVTEALMTGSGFETTKPLTKATSSAICKTLLDFKNDPLQSQLYGYCLLTVNSAINAVKNNNSSSIIKV